MSSTRNFINITNKYDRVVLLVDMDCFYCQVEEKLDPTLAGKPIAVVQYNAWRGGGIIAVNYAARAKGVTRHMRGDEAKEQCPDIVLVKVPNVREKADLSKYRDAGKEVANVLHKYTSLLERASVDEAYLDITAEVNKKMENMMTGTSLLEPDKLVNTYAVGYDNIGDYVSEITSQICNPCGDEEYSLAFDADDTPAVRKSDLKLLLGAAYANEIRAAVKKETSYECSAGIAHNKILAKLACGMNKPNKQTILPLTQIAPLFRTLPVSKIKGLGAKFGEEICERLKVKFLGDLLRFSEADLQKKIDEKNGSWVYLVCRGIDLEAVTPRLYSKSIGCCKKFPGRNAITQLKTLENWLTELATEIADRMEKDLEENNRRAKQIVVTYIQDLNSEEVSSSRSAPLQCYDPEGIQKSALDVIRRNTDQFFKSGSDVTLNNPIKFLGISVGKFESITSGAQNTLQQMFANQKKKEPTVSTSIVAEKSHEEETSKVPTKPNILQKMFANQKPIVSTSKPPESPEPQAAKPASKSFFAAHLVKIRQQKAAEMLTAEADKLYCDETMPDTTPENSLPVPSTSSTSNSPIKDCTAPKETTSVFARALAEDSSLVVQPSLSSSSLKRKSTSPPLDSPQNFETAYAEFATPELRDEFFTKCEKCGEQVLSDEINFQSHQDRHLAEELSRQLKEEYHKDRQSKNAQDSSQKKAKTSTSTNSNKKAKTNSPKMGADIKKFMRPLTQSEEPSTSTQVQETCVKCGRTVQKDLMAEHLDYHYARDLQISLNRSEMVTVEKTSAPLNKSIKSPSNVKRAPTSVVSPATKSKPITQFFSQI